LSSCKPLKLTEAIISKENTEKKESCVCGRERVFTDAVPLRFTAEARR